MARLTTNQRISSMNVSLPWRTAIPIPDVVADEDEDRLIYAYQYSGPFRGHPVYKKIVFNLQGSSAIELQVRRPIGYG